MVHEKFSNSNNWVGLAYLADSYDYIQTVNKSFHEGQSLSVEKMTQIGMDGLLTANYIDDTFKLGQIPYLNKIAFTYYHGEHAKLYLPSSRKYIYGDYVKKRWLLSLIFHR